MERLDRLGSQGEIIGDLQPRLGFFYLDRLAPTYMPDITLQTPQSNPPGLGPSSGERHTVFCERVTVQDTLCHTSHLSPTVDAMWVFALWGAAGAAINRALIFLEANRRVKGPPLRYPQGPGPGFFALATALHCGTAAAVTYAAAVSGYIHTPLLGLGLGAAAPVAVKTVSRMALAAFPSDDSDEGPDKKPVSKGPGERK